MTIDWKNIKSIGDLLGIEDSSLYDESPSIEDEGDLVLPVDLTEEEVEDALFWARYRRGFMLITGAPGAGKGLLAIMIAWKMRFYFGKTILLDYMPRKAFGLYHPFNDAVFVDQLARMSDVARGNVEKGIAESKGGKKHSELLENVTREWIAKEGQVFLKNAVLNLDEIRRYLYKRRPFGPVGMVLGDLLTIWRHLDLLVIGMTLDKNELDTFSCIPRITSEVRCAWLSEKTIEEYGLAPYSAKCTIYPTKYMGAFGQGILEVSGKPETFVVEGGKPRERLGGLRWVDLYNSKDAKIIKAPRSLSYNQ